MDVLSVIDRMANLEMVS